MPVRVVTEDAPVIRVSGVGVPKASSSVAQVNTVNVSQSNQVVNIPVVSRSTVEISSLASADINVDVPEVRPFKAIIYQGPKGDPGIASSGSAVIVEDFTVTNTVGDVAYGYTIPQLTDIELVVREMLTNSDVEISNLSAVVKYNGNIITKDSIHDKAGSVSVESISFTITNANRLFGFPVYSTHKETGQFLLSIPTGDFEQLKTSQNLTFNVQQTINNLKLGKNTIDITYGWLNELSFNANPSSLEAQNKEIFSFFLGKKIRALTSVCSDPYGSNISNLLTAEANVYSTESYLITGVLNQNPNEELSFSFISDFTSEERECILPLAKGNNAYSVNDPDRYTILEVPQEFEVTQVAATSAGTGAYSLTNSIVYLGSENAVGTQYVNSEGHPVRYYRFITPGGFTEDIKLDLQVTLVE